LEMMPKRKTGSSKGNRMAVLFNVNPIHFIALLVSICHVKQ
jgi:hypothetical protein